MQVSVRNFCWRFGRKIYCWARGDLPRGPDANGEYWLLEQVLRTARTDAVVFDVGAHMGYWSLRAQSCAKQAGKRVSIRAFEPCSSTAAMLRANIQGQEGIEILPFALSSEEGEVEFYSSGVGCGTNSLSPVSGDRSERVRMLTLDRFADDRGIETIDFLKVDTEGFDFNVLRGARGMLEAGRIEVVQFEYNWRWLINRASLRDVFELIQGMPYRLGKLVGESIEFYPHWHFELDRYFENNYVLIRSGNRLLESASLVRFDASNAPAAGNGSSQ